MDSRRGAVRPSVRCLLGGWVVRMAFAASQNLPEPLEQAEADYRDRASLQRPPTARTRAQLATRLVANVRLGLDDPPAFRRLHEASAPVRAGSALPTLLPDILDGAMTLTGAQFGTIQIMDPATGALRLVTHSGFDAEFIEYFAVVDDDSSACGRAAANRVQTVIPDVQVDPAFAPHRRIAAASDFRAVQSTPLVDHDGRTVGVLSTHFRRVHRPSAAQLRLLEFYGDLAGDAIARQLRHEPDLEPARLPDSEISRLAHSVVNQLFSVGLTLDGARSLLDDGPARDRVAAATAELDRLVRDVRAAVLDRAPDPADRHERTRS